MGTEICGDCGGEYERIRQHWAMSDCSADEENSSKVQLTCAECGDKFDEYRYRVESDRPRDGTNYCSRECKHAAEREGEVVECYWCGQDTYKSPSHLKNDDRHFCDLDCESEWRSEFISGTNAPWWKGGSETVECEHCGDEYNVRPARADITRFCSQGCQVDAIRPGETDPEWVTKKCAACGADITRRAHEFRGEAAVCDQECFGEWMSEQKRGPKNPAWKGGKSLTDRVRAGLGARSWNKIAAEQRKKVGHECEECGKSPDGRRLSVHHIIPVASGGTHDDWNLMVLCNECHRRVENYTRQITDPHIFSPLQE